MKKMINTVHLEGILYEHNLEKKVSGATSANPNTEYITGTISIATNDAMTNIVPVHYTYVTAVNKNGRPNNTYTALNNILEGTYHNYMSHGIDKAVKLSIDSAIALNEFYSDRYGKEELVSVKRNEGGFITRIDMVNEDEKLRNTFKTDIVITKVTHVEANEERQTPEKAIIKGDIFNFRNDILPVELSATNDKAIAYFESLEASEKNPIFTTVWGHQISETIVRQIRTESAFGEDEIREVKNTYKDYVVYGASREEKPWDDESTITAAEMNDAMKKREIDLAAMKKRSDEYKASRNNQSVASVATPSVSGTTFNF